MKKGFTLAEVLITLVIIGVIAAMTIPALINKTNEQETVVAVKKAYSTVSQAYQKVIAENGEIDPSILGAANEDATKSLGQKFAKQLNAQKICGQTAGGGCWANVMYKNFRGADWNNLETNGTDYLIQLSDGMSVAVYGYSTYQNIGNNENLKNILGDLHVDINGAKGPNVIGKDVFEFYITKNGILPAGVEGDNIFPLSTCKVTGPACTAWIIAKGNMDYLRKDISW